MNKKRIFLLAIAATLAWIGVVVCAGFGGAWMTTVAPEDDADAFLAYAKDRLETQVPGAAALLLIEDQKPAGEIFVSPSGSVDENTVFAAASMSKWVAAYAVMTLVQDGLLELDAPVERYLTRWQLPDTGFDNRGVTVRRLLSHTAGFDDGLGYADYAQDQALPTLEESLANPKSSSGAEVRIGVGVEPGSEWRYSGGSYLLLELLVEEVSQLSFEEFVQRRIFDALDMSRSGYAYLGSYDNNAGNFAADGTRIPASQYASSAATGLVISSADVARFALAQLSAPDHAGLSPALVQAMRVPHGRTMGADIWGLGTILYAPTPGGDLVFGHDGSNDPAINTAARINPETGDALIVLVTGHPGIASNIGSEWVLWQTGYPDVLAFDAVLASMVAPALWGLLAIAASVWLALWRRRRAQA